MCYPEGVSGLIIGYILGAVVLAGLVLAVWRMIKKRSAGCCYDGAAGGRAWGETADKGDTAIDPVCNMTVTPATAAASADYRGATYFFCAARCREEFVRDPEKYLGAAARR